MDVKVSKNKHISRWVDFESREFRTRKDSHSTKLERTPQLFVKLSFRELRGSKLSGLHHFDNTTINH